MSSEAPNTAALERWLLRLVSHPEGVAAGFVAAKQEGLIPASVPDLAALVPPSPTLSPVEQVEVYGFMFFARQVDVLVAECPAATAMMRIGTALFQMPSGMWASCIQPNPQMVLSAAVTIGPSMP